MQSLGYALYRCGDWKGCIETLRSLPVEKPGDNRSFFLAMAYWQLGENTQAKACFDGANEWLKEWEHDCEEAPKKYLSIYPPVSLEKRLQAEAAALLGVTLPTAESAPEPAAKVEKAEELPKSTPAPEAAKEEEESHMKQSPGPMAPAGFQRASCLPPAACLVVTPNCSLIRQVRQPRKRATESSPGRAGRRRRPRKPWDTVQAIDMRRSSPLPANTPVRCRDRKRPRFASHSIVGVTPNAA